MTESDLQRTHSITLDLVRDWANAARLGRMRIDDWHRGYAMGRIVGAEAVDRFRHEDDGMRTKNEVLFLLHAYQELNHA